MRLFAETGLVFATGMLGSLLAGFSIFASVTKPDLFIALANIKYRKAGISRLKYVFFNFMVVFVHYLAFLAVCLFVHLVFAPGTPFTKLLALATQGNELARYVMAASVVVIVGTWFVWVLLMLKMFIWNLYQSVLLSITTEEMPRQEKAKRSD